MSKALAARLRKLLTSPQGFAVAAVAGAMLAAAALALAGLGNQLFWDDEANTAIYARNLLSKKFRRLTAWDGTNLVGYSYGGALGDDLGKELRVPGLPACVAALGFLLFGESTFGGRIMFVAAGVLSVGLLGEWMRRFLGRRFPWYLPAWILALSPALLLYIRNCRYYALGVLFTLLLWVFWTPDASPARAPHRLRFDPRLLLRYAGAVIALLLLFGAHYLNAAAAMVTLPVFFLDRRYRRPRQYVLLAILTAMAAGFGIRLWLTANPFAAVYQSAANYLISTGDVTGPWEHFYTNFGKYLRDLGTHEFFPWCLVPVLLVPGLVGRAGRLRRWARRGAVLLAVVVAYVFLAAVLTPPDMGKGPVAEMRYVVPLIAVGSAVGGLAVALLWRLARPLGAVAMLLLVATNLLHLGFLADRADETNPCWPPTLYRYVAETFEDYPTGNEAMIELLKQLPEGTTVRIWPPHLVYPPMFYAPRLHYCDQLTLSKDIRPDLRAELKDKDYLFAETSRPEVMLIPIPFVYRKLAEMELLGKLRLRPGKDTYRLREVLLAPWDYTWKPEIPAHFFSLPKEDLERSPGIAVLVREGALVEGHPALQGDPCDAELLYRKALVLRDAQKDEEAEAHLEQAVQLKPDHLGARCELGTVLLEREEYAQAIEHFEAAIRLDPNCLAARVNLGRTLVRLGRIQQAREQYLKALEIRPGWATAHFNLGNLALGEPGGKEEAIRRYKAALRSNPRHAKAHVNLGVVLLERDRVKEAMGHFQAALEIEPAMVRATIGLARALIANGQEEAGIARLRAALQQTPADSPAAEQIREILKEFEKR